MNPYFAFIDESGVLQKDPNQPFFALGMLLIEDTSTLFHEITLLKRQASTATGDSRKAFEFKFKEITYRSRPFYERLIDTACSGSIEVKVRVLDKSRISSEGKKYIDIWESYNRYIGNMIEESVQGSSQCIVVADYLTRPRHSDKYLERELKRLPQVVNAMMLESHASVMIQLIDVLVGCVIYQFRQRSKPQAMFDMQKRRISDYLAERMERDTLAEPFAIQRPIPFEVRMLEP
ncbi:MAG: DUF3800 domain-containing protein [bacterium]|nr:DUF3800 domain-containing protein [bacterium]